MTEVDNGRSTCNLDQKYGYIKTSTPLIPAGMRRALRQREVGRISGGTLKTNTFYKTAFIQSGGRRRP